MSHDPRAETLAIWLVEQQQKSHLAQQQQPAGELHLHQHHHAAPAPAPVAETAPQTVRMHPLFVAVYMLFVSVALSLPLALIAAIVDTGNRPTLSPPNSSVRYLTPYTSTEHSERHKTQPANRRK